MFEDKKIMGLICARGGSKGIPNKNIREIGGKPLIAWSIDKALACPFFDKLIVSTDSKKIASIAESYGAEVPFIRPSELAGDNSPEWQVWQHALTEIEMIENFKPDYLVILPPTSPFRSINDIKRGIDIIHKGEADMVISVTESCRNPYFNMVEINPDGFACLSKISQKRISQRQDAPPVYDMTTVLYVSGRDYILKAKGTFDGKVKAITVPVIRALDIDTELDLRFAEFLIAEGMLGKDEEHIGTDLPSR